MHTRTDAASVITTYDYDGLDRLKSKTYSDGKTSAVWMRYDSLAYGKGRQTQITTQAGDVSITNEITEYDALGRVLGSKQVLGTDSYAFRYGYNLADFMISEVYPSGRKVVYEPDGMNRAKAVGQDVNGQKSYYASGVQYAPHGGRMGYTMGNQVQRVFGYNSRLQLGTVTDTLNGAPLLSLTNAWTNVRGEQNNGNLYAQTIAGGGQTFNQSFTYDMVNRLLSAQEGNHWVRNFGYDAFGNMYVSSWAGSMSLASFTPTNSAWFDGNNRLTNPVLGISYDTPGNLKTIGGQSFEHDAENRQTSASINGISTVYRYDGNGRRVQTAQGAVTTNFVYDINGNMAAQYGVQPAVAACTTCYVSSDHLGSTRMMTDSQGQVIARHDYLPFGEEIIGVGERTVLWGASDTASQKFTGKERDGETGLDYFGARYMSSAQGRFTSPDVPLIDQFAQDPQSWNLYSYVRNNPLANVDPNGEDCITTSNQTLSGVTVTTERGGSAETCSGTYVAGTVDTSSYNYNGTSLSYSFSTDTASGAGTIAFSKYFNDDSLSPFAAATLSRAGAMAEPGVNLAAQGLRMFGYAVAAPAMVAAECAAGAPSCTGGNVAMALLPELAALKAGGTILKVGATTGKGAEIIQKAGGVGQAVKDFEALGGTESVSGAVRIKTFSDGSRAVLYTSSSTGQASIAIQEAGRTATKIRY